MANLGSSNNATGVVAGGSGNDWTPLTQLTRDVYSREILYQAQPNLLFPQFATRKTELGSEPGKIIKITKFKQLSRGGNLDEAKHIESKKLEATQIPIEVVERGNAVSTTEFLLRTSFRQTMSDVAQLLAIDYAWVTNIKQQNLFYADPLVSTIFGGGATNYGGRASRDLIVATDYFSMRMLFDAVEILSTNKAIKFGTEYVAILTPKQVRHLLNDPEFVKVIQYGNAQKIFNAEVGKIANVRVLESTTMNVYKPHATDMPIFQDNEDTLEVISVDPNTTVEIQTGVVFGYNAFGFAEGLPVELRDGGVVDYGRERNLAWYAIAGEGMIESNRAVIIESA